MRKLIFGLLVTVLVVFGSIFFIKTISEVEQKYTPRSTEQSTVHKPTVEGAAQWLAERRANLETGEVDIRDVNRAMQQIAELRRTKGGIGLQWEYMGPDNTGGRTRAILIDPENPNIIYAGGVSGGLWKSETAGGSWRQIIYEGDEYTDGIPNLNISNICMTVNGDIYFGTGEGFYKGQGTGTRGFDGAGIWKSTDGENFYRLPSTWSESGNNTFNFVQKLAAHPTIPDKVFAASNRGLQITEDGGETWYNPVLNVAQQPINDFAGDVKLCSNGEVVITKVGAHVYVSHEGGKTGTFERVSGTGDGQIPTAARTEFAIAPSNANYIYAQSSQANGQLQNVYRSRDGGYTWDIIGPGGSIEFNPLGDQGTFNNTIHVYPDDKDRLILGGQYSLWTWGKTEGWNTRTFWNLPKNNVRYVHADQHEIRFHPTNPDIIYVGSDGGISRSLDGGITWHNRNKFYGITQFYAIGFGPRGSIIGGTQDNGTLYWDYKKPPTQGTRYEYQEVAGGDGGKSEISQINPDFLFATIYFGNLYRTEHRGEQQMVPFYNSRLLNNVSVGNQADGHPFITPIALWESFYDENSIDYVHYSPTFDIEAGAVIQVESNISGIFYDYELTEDITPEDTITVHDTYQSRLAVGFRGSVWMTSKPMNLREPANWLPVLNFEDNGSDTYWVAQHMDWSADGDILYVAANSVSGGFLSGSALYRIKGFNQHRADTTRDFVRDSYALEHAMIARFNNRIITGIAIDPEFAGNVVVTLGNYGATNFVYHSTSANVDPAVSSGHGNFVSKQGNLPQMPVYDALILWNDSKKVIVGTEFGVYSTTDITAANPSWYDENETFDYVATYHLRQQYHRNGWIHEINRDSGVRNHGHVWAGTHGRGIFRTKQFAGPVNIEPITVEDRIEQSNISTFPNPAVDNVNLVITLENSADVQIQIFDLQGKVVRGLQYGNLPKGKSTKQVNISDFNAGVYVVRMRADNEMHTTRFIVQ